MVDEISKHRSDKEIGQQYTLATGNLSTNLTYFKQHVLNIIINIAVCNNEHVIKPQHLKRFDSFLHERPSQ